MYTAMITLLVAFSKYRYLIVLNEVATSLGFFSCGRLCLNHTIQKDGGKAREWLSDSRLRGRLEADFRSSQKHSMSQPKLGENWPSKEGCNQKRNVILWYCLQNWRLWQPLGDSWSSIVSNPCVNVWFIYLVLLAGVV